MRRIRQLARACGLSLLLARTANAQDTGTQVSPDIPPPVPLAETLHVEPGATCLEPDQLILQIQSWLQFEALDPRISVDVHGDPSRKNAVRFTVSIDGTTSSTRTFDPAPDACLDLHAVVGLAVAMAIEVAVVESAKLPATKKVLTQQTSPSRPEPTPTPTPQPELPVTAPQPRPDPPANRVTSGLFVHGLMMIGLPELAGGGSLGMDLSFPHWLSLRAAALGGYRKGLSLGSGSLDVGLVAGRVSTCFGRRPQTPPRARIRVCTGIVGGAVIATGHGFEAGNYRITRGWVAATAGLHAAIPVARRFALEFGVDAVVSVLRPEFSVLEYDGELAYNREVATFGVLAGIGGQFTFH